MTLCLKRKPMLVKSGKLRKMCQRQSDKKWKNFYDVAEMMFRYAVFSQAHKEKLDHKARGGGREAEEAEEHQEVTVTQESLGSIRVETLVFLASMATPDLKETRGQQGHRDQLVLPDHRD